jgi:hypothetical protein
LTFHPNGQIFFQTPLFSNTCSVSMKAFKSK